MKIRLNDGREIAIRQPRKGDERKMLAYINELIEEKVYISSDKKKTLRDEREFLKSLLIGVKSGKKVALVFESGGRIIAMAETWKCYHDKDRHVCNFALAVSKDFRGIGLGNSIMEMLIQASRKKLGCRIARLSVYRPNKRAISLYRKHGFRQTGTIPNGIRHSGKFIDEIIMVRKL